MGQALEDIVLRCLEKRQDDRPQDARELRDALLALPAAPLWSRARAQAWWEEHEEIIARSRRDQRDTADAKPLALTVAAGRRD